MKLIRTCECGTCEKCQHREYVRVWRKTNRTIKLGIVIFLAFRCPNLPKAAKARRGIPSTTELRGKGNHWAKKYDWMKRRQAAKKKLKMQAWALTMQRHQKLARAR